MEFFTSVAGSSLLLVVGIALFIVLCYRNVHTGVAAIIAAVVVGLGTEQGLILSIFDTFTGGVGTLVTSMFGVFTASGLLGYLMQETGASMSIGNKFIKMLGVDRAPYILALTTSVLLMAGVGNYIFVIVVLASALMEAASLPRRIGLVSCVGIAPMISFCLPVPSVPNSLPGIFLGTSPFGAPLLSCATGAVGMILFFPYLQMLIKQARKLGLGYDGPRSAGVGSNEKEKEQDLPSFSRSISALLVVVVVAVILSNLPQEVGLSATAAVTLAQLAGCATIILCNFKRCKEDLGFVNIFSKGATGMWPFLVLAGCVMGFGLVVQQTTCFQVIIDWVFGLQLNPYISAWISVAIVAGLCADGISAMMMWLPIFGQQYISMGVNPQALHRLLVSTTQTFDSLPHSQSTAISLSIFGLTHKEAYKEVFVTTVIIPVVFSLFCCVMCMIFYPVAG